MADTKIIDEKVQALRRFKDRVDEIIIEEAKKQEEEILIMVKQEQLFQGIDAQGRQISPPYAESTIKRKIKKGQPTDRVTLKDTGFFYFSFFIDYQPKEFTIQAEDIKTIFLLARYGLDILGLTPDNIDKLSGLIRPELLKRLKGEL